MGDIEKVSVVCPVCRETHENAFRYNGTAYIDCPRMKGELIGVSYSKTAKKVVFMKQSKWKRFKRWVLRIVRA